MRYLIRLVLYYPLTVSREFVVLFLCNSLKDVQVFSSQNMFIRDGVK